jgi:UDP-2-acetamido-3-amino-2,3-dideoxy-glucuronate N-acetyltransferase
MAMAPSASPLAPGLMLGEDVRVGEGVSFGTHVVIHDGVIVGDGCTIEDGAVLGKPPRLGPNSRTPSPEAARLVLAERAVVCSHAVVCFGARIGVGAIIGDHAFVREGAEIGAGSVVGEGGAIGRGVRIGAGVRLQNKVGIAHGSVVEDDAFFGPLAVALNDPTIGRREATGTPIQGVIVRRASRVGASVVLMPGVELGEECVVGAGSVVTRSVAARTVVRGSPAREIRAVDPRELLD